MFTIYFDDKIGWTCVNLGKLKVAMFRSASDAHQWVKDQEARNN